MILIVDNASSDRYLLTEILTRQGYEVHAMVPDDVTARVIVELSPDLIVLDWERSAIIERLKAQELRNVPILFSGAMDAGMDRGQVFVAGGVDYLIKPFQAEEVLARVETHLTLRSLQRQVVEKNAQVQQEAERRQHTEASLQDMNEILERRIIERTATLRASEAMFRYLLARANDGYVIVNDQEQVVYANVQARVYLGLGQEINPEAAPFFRELIVKQYRCEPQAAWALWPKKMFINKSPVPLYLVRPETPVSNVFWLQVEMLDIAMSDGLPERGPRGGVMWPLRYYIRRSVWHTLDHAWEIEDRVLPA
jgi:DNA-binding response OmpR family regulator